MSTDKVLADLLAIRRGHEQRALDLLTRREAELWRAEAARANADDEALRHQAESEAREREELRALTGRPVSAREIVGLQDRLDVMATEQARLKAAGEAATQHAAERASARDEGKTAFHARQRAAAKLALLADERARIAARRETALAEDADDESNSRSARPVGDGHRA